MNILIDIEFDRGTEYYATSAASYSGNQYLPKLIDVSSLSMALGDEKDFQVSGMTFRFEDKDRHFREKVDGNLDKYMVGTPVIIRQPDGTQIREFKVESYSPGKDTFTLTVSDNVLELSNVVVETIREDYFPSATSADCYGQAIPLVFQNSADIVTFKAWNVQKSATCDYLLSSQIIDSVMKVEEDGVDVPSGWSIANLDGYYYLTYAAGTADFVTVSAYRDDYSAYETIETLMQTYFTNFGGATWTDSALSTYLTRVRAGSFYTITERLTGSEILKHVCDSYQIEWIIDSTGAIKFKWLDITDLTPDDNFQAGEIFDFEYEPINAEDIENAVLCNFGYKNLSESYSQAQTFTNANSISRYGLYTGVLNLRHIDGSENAFATRSTAAYKAYKRYQWLKMQPPLYAAIKVPITRAISLELGDIITATCPLAIDAEERTYQIRKIDLNFQEGTASLRIRDITFLNDFRANDVLLVQSRPDTSSRIFLDSAIDGWHDIYNTGGKPAYSTAQTHFNSTSIYFDGTTRLDIRAPANDFDLYDQATVTADFWIYSALGSRDTYLCWYGSDAAFGDYWQLEKTSSNYLRFFDNAGSIDVTSTAAVTTGWHHIALIQVDGVIGVYLDGVQVLYTAGALADINVERLYFGATWDDGDTFTGYLDELRFTHDNFFGAAPVVGLTDEIIVPVAAYSEDYGPEVFITEESGLVIATENEELIILE